MCFKYWVRRSSLNTLVLLLSSSAKILVEENDQRFCCEDLAETRRDCASSFAGHHLLVIDMLFTQHDAISNNDVREPVNRNSSLQSKVI